MDTKINTRREADLQNQSRLHDHYCNGGDLAMAPLFTVMYAMRSGEPLSLRGVCFNLTAYAVLNGDAKEIARRRITTHLARAARNKLIEKDFEAPGRTAIYTLTDKGAAFVRAGMYARLAVMAEHPQSSVAMVCACITVRGGGIDTTHKRRERAGDEAETVHTGAAEAAEAEQEDSARAGEVAVQIVGGGGKDRRFLERVCRKQPDLMKAWGIGGLA